MESKTGFLSTVVAVVVLAGCGDSGSNVTTAPSPIGGSSTNPTVTASGTSVTQTRQVSGFDAVTIGVPGRLTIEHGSTSSLTIVGDEAVLSVITSEVRDSELIIAQTPNTDLRLDDPLEIEYRVTVETLRRLAVNGTVHATASGVTASPFEVSINGDSMVTVSGSTNRQIVSVFGSSRYEARALVSRDTVLDVTGSAFVLVNVRDTLTGQVTGAAIVRYVGSPDVSVSVTGAASVEPE